MVIVVPLGKRTGSLRQERPFLQFAPLWTTCLSKENPCVGFLFIYLFFYFSVVRRQRKGLDLLMSDVHKTIPSTLMAVKGDG